MSSDLGVHATGVVTPTPQLWWASSRQHRQHARDVIHVLYAADMCRRRLQHPAPENILFARKKTAHVAPAERSAPFHSAASLEQARITPRRCLEIHKSPASARTAASLVLRGRQSAMALMPQGNVARTRDMCACHSVLSLAAPAASGPATRCRKVM
jgi:hypothetical protein